MKFDYLVLHNGVYYKPGEEVPMGESKETKSEKVETIAEETVEKPKGQPGRKKKSE